MKRNSYNICLLMLCFTTGIDWKILVTSHRNLFVRPAASIYKKYYLIATLTLTNHKQEILVLCVILSYTLCISFIRKRLCIYPACSKMQQYNLLFDHESLETFAWYWNLILFYLKITNLFKNLSTLFIYFSFITHNLDKRKML